MAGRQAGGPRLTDRTLRVACQRMPSVSGQEGLRELARRLDGAGFEALEAFGGAGFGAGLERGADPWDGLRRLRQAISTTPLQALVRGQALFGPQTRADDAVELFVEVAASHGVDIFRVFDPLNDVRNLLTTIRAVRRRGRRARAVLFWSPDSEPATPAWCELARSLAEEEVEALVIRDSAGLLGPRQSRTLISELRAAIALPLVISSRAGAGLAPMSYLAAAEAGAAGLEVVLAAAGGPEMPPSAESLVRALAGGPLDTGIDGDRLAAAGAELEDLVVQSAGPPPAQAEGWVGAGTDAAVLRYRLPAALLADLRRELDQHGAGARLAEAAGEAVQVRRDLGRPPPVTPVRQMLARQAVFNLLGGERYATVSQDLKDFLQGLWGAPPEPADEAVRRQVLGQDQPLTLRPADLCDPEVEPARERLRKRGLPAEDADVVTHLMFPAAATERLARPPGGSRAASAAEMPEAPPEVAPEVEETAAIAASAPPLIAIPATELVVEVEGEVFRVRVSGAGQPAATPAVPATAAIPAPAPAGPAPRAATDGAVLAPMQGLIVKVPVRVGDTVSLGDVLVVLEAMKMQNDIVATQPGRVLELYVSEGEVVRPNQPLVAVG